MYLILSIPGGADRLFPRPAIRTSMHNDNSPNLRGELSTVYAVDAGRR